MNWSRLLARAIAMLLAAALAAFDTAIFYLIVDHVIGWTVTWPIVAVVYWVQETTFGITIRSEFRKEGLL